MLAIFRIGLAHAVPFCRLRLHPSCVYIGCFGVGILWDFALGHYTVLRMRRGRDRPDNIEVRMKRLRFFHKADSVLVDRFYWRLRCTLPGSLAVPMERPIQREISMSRTSRRHQHPPSSGEVGSSYARSDR